MNITTKEKVYFELMVDCEINRLREIQIILVHSDNDDCYTDYLNTIYDYEKRIDLLMSLCDKINKEYYK